MMLRHMWRPALAPLVGGLAAVAIGVAIAVATFGLAVAAPELQPKTTHDVQGREDCLICHQVGGGVKPSPSNHAAYTNAMCLGCHPAGNASRSPEPPKQEAPVSGLSSPSPQSPNQPASEGQKPASTSSQTLAPAPTGGGNASTALSAPTSMPFCLDCHKNPGLAMTLPSGESLGLFVDEASMSGSVHGGKLTCTDCHSRINSVPHKRIQVSDRREYSIAQYEACKRCHFTNYTKTLDSIHYKVMEAGNLNAPLCTDCHGYHDVTKPDQPRSRISASCAKCHRQIYDAYTKSVHGAALMQEDNKDVPVCTDCHGTHTIQDATSASFRLNSPEMCARCHADATLMAKYNLSPNVFKTYVQDFHGATVALTKRQGLDNWTEEAVCSDCHGVHDIQSVKKGNPAQLKQNLVATCRKCHPDAGTNFPDAWLGHYEVSPDKTPLTWAVRAWYVIFIPFMIGGLLLHIVVDLWRVARNR